MTINIQTKNDSVEFAETIFLDQIQSAVDYNWCWAEDLMLELARIKADVLATVFDLSSIPAANRAEQLNPFYEDLLLLAKSKDRPLIVRNSEKKALTDKVELKSQLGLSDSDLTLIPALNSFLDALAANAQALK